MDRRIPQFLLMAALAAMLAACMPETPETAFSWGVNDRIAHVKAKPVSSARDYAYEAGGEAAASPPLPTPRPDYRPAAVQRSTPVYEYREPGPASHAAGPAAFAWPINGPVISGFGATSGGERNDGINISARLDAPIRAAASGTVSYADDLNGYGKLVLIKHPNGYVTAYAHADRLLVARGDFVAKGQVIAYAGQSGDVPSPQLHFEIRDGVTPVDPQRYLTARAGA